MTAYRYRALDPKENWSAVCSRAIQERQVRSQLRLGQSLRPVEVAVANRPEPTGSGWRIPCCGAVSVPVTWRC